MIRAVSRILSCALGLTWLAGASAQSLEVTYLANEGFLLRSGELVVIIDGLLERETYGMYAALPDTVYADAIAGKPPFDGVDLLLVSHEHEDHFQSTAAHRFLETRPATKLISSPQVVKRLGIDGDNVSSVWPEKGEVLERNGLGVQVEFMQFSHGRGKHASVQNLAHVIHLGGYTVLHLGDAAMEEFSFSTYYLSERWFDVAIVPYWFFEFAPGQAIVRRQINANHIIAAHIPPAELEEVKAMLARDWPEVIVFENALDSRTF